MPFKMHDEVETEYYGQRVRGNVIKINSDGSACIVAGTYKGQSFRALRNENSAWHVEHPTEETKQPDITFCWQVVDALTAYVEHWREELQNSGGYAESEVIRDLEHILETGENPRHEN